MRDFAHEELARNEIGDEDREVVISGQRLCQYLAAAENKVRGMGSLGKHRIAPGLKKRRRSDTPPEQIGSGDEAMYVEQEQRAARRIAENDLDYEDMPTTSTSSD